MIYNRYRCLAGLSSLVIEGIAPTVWVSEGLKPVSHAELLLRCPGDVELFSEIVKKLGLKSTIEEPQYPHAGHQVFLSRSAKILSDFMRGCEQCRGDRDYWYRSLGQYFGYPATAVEGFVKKKMIDEPKILSSILSEEEAYAFLFTRPFRLSEDHWREELRVAQYWIAVLRQRAPDVYNLVVSQGRKEEAHRAKGLIR